MKDKRGQEEPLALKNLVGIILAIAIVVLILIFIVPRIVSNYYGRQDIMQAKNTLDRVIEKMNNLQEGQVTNYLLTSPNGWHLVAFDSQHNTNGNYEKPKEMYQKNILCICSKSCSICQAIKIPFFQQNKPVDIKIEIKEIWIINYIDHYELSKEKVIMTAELTETEKQEFQAGLENIKNYEDKIVKAASENYESVKTELASQEKFQDLIKAVIWKSSKGVESALSVCGAAGLMQLMPDIANRYTEIAPLSYNKICWETNLCQGNYASCTVAFECNSVDRSKCKENDERFNADKNIIVGTKHLAILIKKFNDVYLGLAAYSGSSDSIEKFCKQDILSCPKDYLPRRYAEKVMAFYYFMQQPIAKE